MDRNGTRGTAPREVRTNLVLAFGLRAVVKELAEIEQSECDRLMAEGQTAAGRQAGYAARDFRSVLAAMKL